ncbi:MAG: VWA domain-containing protein [Acidobacteria bacterium]|nr:VWA domain-containing protein [Acidobacteriota bacterium]
MLPAAAAPRLAQEPPLESPRLRVDVRLVNVDVAVLDASGRHVPNLVRQNFLVKEDGQPQAITHFVPTTAPIRVALLIEANPAVFLLQREHVAMAARLLRALRPEDEVALLSYARELHGEIPFTRDKHLVEERLGGLGRFGLGMAEMNLHDAVAEALAGLSPEGFPPPRRTAVVLVGTGLDTGSRVPWEALEARVGASQVTFFPLAVGRLLVGETDTKRKRGRDDRKASEVKETFAEADARLRALAEASAGQAYFPESAAELDRIYAEIGERLRNLYSLAYQPANTARDGRYRRISVELVDENGAPLAASDPSGKPATFRVFARPGYFTSRD